MIYLIIVLLAFLPGYALAHCPLCTIGAGAVATGAMFLGIANSVIGVFMGAFAVALGLWISKYVNYKWRYKDELLAVVSWVLTVMPLQPMFKSYTSIYIMWFGEYGSVFNRTYIIEKFIIGSIVGAFIVYLSPYISKKITMIRGKTVSFQGMIITFTLLILVGIIFQIVL